MVTWMHIVSKRMTNNLYLGMVTSVLKEITAKSIAIPGGVGRGRSQGLGGRRRECNELKRKQGLQFQGLRALEKSNGS